MHKGVKGMVMGAMIASVFGMLSIFNTYTGSMFDIFICYIMVIPFAWYGYTYDIRDNVIVGIVSFIVVALLGVPFFVISALSSILVGIYIGECLKRDCSRLVVFGGSFFVMLLNNIFIYEIFAGVLGMDLITEMSVMYDDLCLLMPSLMGFVSKDLFVGLIPVVLIIMSLMETYMVILLCELVLSRFRISFRHHFHIGLMHLSKRVGIVLLLVMVLSYVLNLYFDRMLLVYIYTLCLFVFCIQGLAFVSFYFIVSDKAKWSGLAFLGVFIPFVFLIYGVIGLLDIFSDLRGNILYNSSNG